MLKQFARAGVAGLALAGFITTAQATGLGSGDGSWAGVYVGGHAGGGWGDADVTADVTGGSAFVESTARDSYDLEGWLAGAHIGANVQHGAWVIGGELSLSAADIDGSKNIEGATQTSFGESGSFTISFPGKKDDEWLLLAMSRFGYAPGNWMGYLTLGVAVVGAQTSNEQALFFKDGRPTFGPALLSAGSSTDVGFAIGGGAEFQLGHGLIAGVEYIHADFDDMRDGGVLTPIDYAQDIDIVRTRLSLMLDSCCDGAAAAPSKTGFAGILPAAGNTWSGIYFGGHSGYGWADTDVTINGDTFLDTFTDKNSFDQDGWLAGLHLGGMVQRGNFVFGTEFSLSAAEIDGSKGENCTGVIQNINAGVGGNFGCRKEDEWLLLAMSRIGYAPSNWMAYVTYGLAIVGGQTDHTANIPELGRVGVPFSSGVNTDASLAIGGGAEIKLGSSIIAGVEYIHADFDGARNGSSEFVVTEWEQDLDIVRARLSLMLNACCDAPAVPSKTSLASAGAAAGWGGFYFGSHLGYGWADADVSFDTFPSGEETIEDGFELEGYLAGAHMGGNVQHGALVLGGELSVSAGEIEGSTGPDCFEDRFRRAFECKKEDKWLLLAMARLGYAPGPWMGYVTGGAAVVGMQTDTVDRGVPQSAGSNTDLGYAVGGGAEFQLGHGLIAGVEYIHAEFDGAQDGGNTFPLDWEQEMDIVRGRLSYKFGGCCEAAPAAVPFK